MKKFFSLITCLFITVLTLHAQSTTFRFSMSSDGTGLCIDKYTGDSQYVVINAYYDGLAVKEIGQSAFRGTNVISVNIPDCVESIGFDAFSDCKNLTTVTLPLELEYLGDAAFYRCSNLCSVKIRSVNIKFGWSYDTEPSTFKGCTNLPMSTQIQLIKLGYKGSF